MSALFGLEAEWDGDVPVARLSGEIDASNATEVGDRLRDLLSNRSLVLVVDLTDTGYLDSAGINLLFTLGEEMRGRQQRLRLVVRDGSPITRVISVTGLAQVVPVHATLAQALERAREDDDDDPAGTSPGAMATPD